MQRHETHSTLVNPEIEGLLDRADSKFRLVTLTSTRARQINAYFGQLGEGLGSSIPPQVTSTARKPLSIAFEEIAADKIIAIEPPDEPTEEELAAIDKALAVLTSPESKAIFERSANTLVQLASAGRRCTSLSFPR